MVKVVCETQDNQKVEVEASLLRQRISVYGLYLSSDSILCVKTHSDRWELPGGTPEPGETLHDALVRELDEEAGIRINVGKLFFQRESFYAAPSGKAYHSVQLYFEITSTDRPRPTKEVTHVQFVPKRALTNDNTNRSSLLAVQSYFDGRSASDFII